MANSTHHDRHRDDAKLFWQNVLRLKRNCLTQPSQSIRRPAAMAQPVSIFDSQAGGNFRRMFSDRRPGQRGQPNGCHDPDRGGP
jgi:hypothetical protein